MFYKYIVSFSIIGANKYISTVIHSEKDALLINDSDINKILERIYGIKRSYISNVNYSEYHNETI